MKAPTSGTPWPAMIAAFLLVVACTSESQQAERELETVRASQPNGPGYGSPGAQALCQAHTKLQQAYLKEGLTQKYRDQGVFVAAYC